jgi:hypothetical protein
MHEKPFRGFPRFSALFRAKIMVKFTSLDRTAATKDTEYAILYCFGVYSVVSYYPSALPGMCREGAVRLKQRNICVPSDVKDITVNYEENGILLVKELDKEILSKGSWATVMFKYQQWEAANQRYGPVLYTIRSSRSSTFRASSRPRRSSVPSGNGLTQAKKRRQKHRNNGFRRGLKSTGGDMSICSHSVTGGCCVQEVVCRKSQFQFN